MSLSYEDALDFVNQQSPASDTETRKWLANKLIEICEREDEPKERSWIIESYWKGEKK